MPNSHPSRRKITAQRGDGSPILLDDFDAARRQVVSMLVLGALGMFILLCLLPATGHDQMWLLYSARLMGEGKTLYGPELMESNPPLIIWLLRLPVILAKYLPGGDAFYLKAITLALAGGMAAWSFSLWQRAVGRISKTARLWLLFSFVVLFGVATARDFAQRDHLLVLLLLPYVASVACRLRGVSLSAVEGVLVGVSAAIGISLKPHHALIFLALEAMLIVRRRSLRTLLRPEPWLIVLLGFSYLAAVLRFTPDYFGTIVPLLRDCYWAFGNRTLLQLIGDAPQLHILALISIALWWRKRESVLTLLLLAGAAATIAYYAQGTGWYYQQLPGISFFGLALALELAPIVERLRLVRQASLYAAVLVAVALFCTTHAMGYPFTADRNFVVNEPDPSLLAQLPTKTPIYILTTDLDLTLPAVTKYNLTWASRMPHTWMLPAILRAQSHDPRVPERLTPERVTQLVEMQHRIVAEDIEQWQPEYIFIHRCYAPEISCQELDGRHDDLGRWFGSDPRFRKAMSHYSVQGPRMSFDVYKRLHSGSPGR